MNRRRRLMQSGLTLIELLVVVAITAVLLIALLMILQRQLSRARDAERKSDLNKIKIAFEDYYNDNGCYPAEDVLQDCGGSSFRPYLDTIPCDPQTKQPYVFIAVLGDACKGYRVLAKLEDTTDPAIKKLGCDDACGCGVGNGYNYGVSAGTPVNSEDCQPLSSPASSPAGSPGSSPQPSGEPVFEFACDHGTGACNSYEVGTEAWSKCSTRWATHEQCDVADCENNLSLRCNL